MTLEQFVTLIGLLTGILPHMLLSLLPFAGRLKTSRRQCALAVAATCLCYLGIGAWIMLSGNLSVVTAQIYLLLFVAASFFLYQLFIDLPLSRLLYCFLIVAVYAAHITGLSNFLEAVFFPETFTVYNSLPYVLVNLALLTLTAPFAWLFLKRQVQPVALSVSSPAWKYMWTIPFVFLMVEIIFTSSFEFSVISSWQYVVTLLLLAFGSFMVFYVVLRMLRESDQNAKLSELTEKLSKQQKTRDIFLQNISHNLRTPITVIRGAADILSESGLDEPKQRVVERIVGRTAQLEKLVEDLLKLITIESGGMKLKPEVFSVDELLKTMAAEYRPMFENKNLSLEIRSIPVSIIADKRRLTEVFDNLLSNALRLTVQGVVTIAAELRDNTVLFSVRDTGAGIADSDLPHIFDRFYRCDGQSVSGSGLGLSICKGLIERMGGEIWVESELGRGTVVWFALLFG